MQNAQNTQTANTKQVRAAVAQIAATRKHYGKPGTTAEGLSWTEREAAVYSTSKCKGNSSARIVNIVVFAADMELSLCKHKHEDVAARIQAALAAQGLHARTEVHEDGEAVNGCEEVVGMHYGIRVHCNAA